MSFGFGGLGLGNNVTDPSDFGLGLLKSASGIDDDSDDALNTPSLSLSNLGTSFDQEIQSALNKMQTQNAGEAVPASQDITAALSAIDQKQPLSDDKVLELVDKFKAFGTHANATAATGGIQSFIALQESLVGLQNLVEQYGSKEAAAAMGTLYGKLDSNNQGKKFIADTFEKWSKIDHLSLKASTKGDVSDESKRSTTREIQYMMFISLQVNVRDQDPLLQTLRESAYVHEACEQSKPDGVKPVETQVAQNTGSLAASEQVSLPISNLKS